jgi:hypothetical protein
MATISMLARGAAQGLMLALLFLFAAAGNPQAAPADRSQQDATAQSPQAAASGAYYVEFRVAQIGTYGHSYIVYGRLNAKGQPAEFRYADLHPIGNYALMALGHIVPVPATTKWDPDVEKLPVSSSWRHKLTAAEYGKLQAAVQRSRTNTSPTWNAVANNCNHYVAGLAKAIGLRTPSDFQVSYTFIPALRDLNEPAKKKQTSAL